MVTILSVWLVNLSRRTRNLWRRLLRRRVAHVRIALSGDLPEFAPAPPWWLQRITGVQPVVSLSEIRYRLRRIAADPSTRSVVLDIGVVTCGWATLRSFHDEVRRFRNSGKIAVAVVANPDTKGYLAACAAGVIVAPPTGLLSITGVYTEVQFLKEALERVGLAVEVTAVSPYKSAGDALARSDMSPEHREQLNHLLDLRYAEMVAMIAAARGKSEDEVRTLIDAAPLSAARARDAGLLDALLYEDELPAYLDQLTTPPAAIRRAAASPPAVAEWAQARRALRLPLARPRRSLVGMVLIEGTIAAGSSRTVPLPLPLIGGQIAGSDSVIQAVRQAERHPRIAAVVVYVNSPGGSAFDADRIWREIARLDRRKPVVVAMGDVAASGGYYVATAARAIVAQPGALTGSIGVLIVRPVIAGLLDQAGVHTVAIGRGANSAFFAGSEPNEYERAATRQLMNDTYATFKQRVSAGRKLEIDELESLAGGRVWSGSEAREHGLVDEPGGVPEALLKAQELAGIPRDRDAPLVLLGGGRSRLQPQPFPADPSAVVARVLAELRRPQVWAVLPFSEQSSVVQ